MAKNKSNISLPNVNLKQEKVKVKSFIICVDECLYYVFLYVYYIFVQLEILLFRIFFFFRYVIVFRFFRLAV